MSRVSTRDDEDDAAFWAGAAEVPFDPDEALFRIRDLIVKQRVRREPLTPDEVTELADLADQLDTHISDTEGKDLPAAWRPPPKRAPYVVNLPPL